jgi:hypothetical protein
MTFLKKILKKILLFKKKDSSIYILILALLLILLKTTDFFKGSFYIVNENYNYRLENRAYDFCNVSGSGYIFYIKRKYKLKKIPQIINFNAAANQNWIFEDFSEFDNKRLILLFNLKKDGLINFDYSNYKILDNYKNNCLFLENNE